MVDQFDRCLVVAGFAALENRVDQYPIHLERSYMLHSGRCTRPHALPPPHLAQVGSADRLNKGGQCRHVAFVLLQRSAHFIPSKDHTCRRARFDSHPRKLLIWVYSSHHRPA